MSVKKLFSILGMVLLFWGSNAFAGGTQSLSQIVSNIQGNIATLGALLTVISYLAGIGFAIAGLVKFKTHKDNPTQVALSQPIVLLCVGAALLFLPSIIETAGGTIFGSGGNTPAATLPTTQNISQ